MNLQQAAFGLPVHLGQWILFGYILTVVIGASVLGRIGRAHFRRAQRFADSGFEYDEEFDHYECPEGERLPLHVLDHGNRVAVYRAPASSCEACSRKDDCAPHGHGRHLYRPLAPWVETDSGRFHQWVAVVINGSAAVVGGVATLLWAGEPGMGLLLLASTLAAGLFIGGLRATQRGGAESISSTSLESASVTQNAGGRAS